MLTITKEPYLLERTAVGYLGIRITTPMRGMHPMADKLRSELDRWLSVRGINAHGLLGNKLLLEAMKNRNWVADRWDDPKGDAFACRCETVLTDRRQFRLKKTWEIEVSIKLQGGAEEAAPRLTCAGTKRRRCWRQISVSQNLLHVGRLSVNPVAIQVKPRVTKSRIC
ncbi:MAG: hypothetical protein WCG80_08270 [Spirochaetales bacterium]